jgi:hypothetical protein
MYVCMCGHRRHKLDSRMSLNRRLRFIYRNGWWTIGKKMVMDIGRFLFIFFLGVIFSLAWPFDNHYRREERRWKKKLLIHFSGQVIWLCKFGRALGSGSLSSCRLSYDTLYAVNLLVLHVYLRFMVIAGMLLIDESIENMKYVCASMVRLCALPNMLEESKS